MIGKTFAFQSNKGDTFMKKLAFILFSFIFLVCAVSCSSQNPDTSENHSKPQMLDTPKVSYKNGTVFWDAIQNADKYEVSINNKIFITYNSFYHLPITNNTLSYTVKVKSVSESKKDSYFSKPLTFSARLLPQITNLSMSFNHIADEYILSWNPSDCEKYKIYINGNINVTENSSLITHSSNYVTGENVISVFPVGNTYDVIPEAATLYLEKSQPFPDVSNIRIEDGNLIYGKNHIYEGYIPEGKTIDFCLSNIEDGKIKSDGPICSVERVLSPKMDSYTYGYSSMESNTLISVNFKIITEISCDNVYIELIQNNKVILNSKEHGSIMRGGDGLSYQIWTITIKTNGYYIPHNTYANVTAFKAGCVNSPTVKYNLV